MPFAYYQRLSPARRALYRRSDGITAVPLPSPPAVRAQIPLLAEALAEEHPHKVQQIGQAIADLILRQLDTPPVQVLVFEVRPRDSRGELHGLYEPSEPPYLSRVSLWMRTARLERVVALRTFLRTLLHELVHHLDYELFGLEETFHTAGFYKRESSLFRQLMPADGEDHQAR